MGKNSAECKEEAPLVSTWDIEIGRVLEVRRKSQVLDPEENVVCLNKGDKLEVKKISDQEMLVKVHRQGVDCIEGWLNVVDKNGDCIFGLPNDDLTAGRGNKRLKAMLVAAQNNDVDAMTRAASSQSWKVWNKLPPMNGVDSRKKTLLHHAIACSSWSVIELLVKKCNVNCGDRDDMNRNVIHLLCMSTKLLPGMSKELDTKYRLMWIKNLHSRGASVYIKDALGREAASYAREFHCKAIVDLLVKLGATKISISEVEQQKVEGRHFMRSATRELERMNSNGESLSGLSSQDVLQESDRTEIVRSSSRLQVSSANRPTPRTNLATPKRCSTRSSTTSIKLNSDPADDVNQNE
eukprot:GEMP01033249.1.p1 GENE.GEMP01033249.1~~GEMP01033249.1.p1  ORF type:complete len:352 (+),score=73.25 GEMP01033249.1:85-1140(+)